ncbi:MAG: RimK-like ATPgrasp N-terminal domain-containing protein, partial [Myxococcales bacterium]|nr:RimK-like ATPgrasp N-terminal domain-containing protein [Myxococcales bacterium]
MSDKISTLVVISKDGELGKVELPGVRVVDAETYLEGGPEVSGTGVTVVNLCRSWRYLSRGYYVSLLAEARGQEPMPTVHDIEGFLDPRSRFRGLHEAGVDVIDPEEARARLKASKAAGRDLGDGEVPPIRVWEQADIVFRAPQSTEIVDLVVVLGHTDTPGMSRLAARVFRAWPFPVLDVRAVRENQKWRVFAVQPRRLARVDATVRDRLLVALEEGPRNATIDTAPKKRSVAVLFDPTDPYRASTPETIERLERVFRRRGLRLETIGTDDLDRVGEHDGLFVRSVTGLDKPAWRFAVRADALGMPVIDHPQDTVRCSNKVYLYELLKRASLPMPTSKVFGAGTTYEEVASSLGTPFVVKLPDGSFSAAVHRIASPEDYAHHVPGMLKRSPLVLAQSFVKSEFDWRVTVLDGRPLFVCRYHMVPGHWQIRSIAGAQVRYGRVESIPRDKAPSDVVKVACKAASLIGEGLYGVDLKVGPDGPLVIEVNDNPNLDTGYDDVEDGDSIYDDIVTWFEKRLPPERATKEPSMTPKQKASDDGMAPLRAPYGRVPVRHTPYASYEVMGLELEYPVVDRDLNCVSEVADLIADLAGRPTSDVDLGLIGISNEIMDHVLEIKNAVPLASAERIEEVLAEGVRRAGIVLAGRHGARLLPGGMHPWFRPRDTKLWTRSNRTIYQTYQRLFDVRTHGWANVQAVHVNLPCGREEEAVAMMNAARLLVPYLPALAASSPMAEGELTDAVDTRLTWILEHQIKLPESCGDLVPEPVTSLKQYKKDVLGRMYTALDRLPDADPIRHEFLNARAAVFKLSRDSMEIRVLDVQECPKMDVAIGVFVKRALKRVAGMLPKLAAAPQEALVADLRATVRSGSRARVLAPWAPLDAQRDADGTLPVSAVLSWLLEQAFVRVGAEERPYLE